MMAALENRPHCCSSTSGELRCACFGFYLQMFNNGFSSSLLLCTIGGQEEGVVWLLIL
jgi:hypothetical protein